MKVYLVTSGEYSAYHVDGVCSTPELAEQLKAFLSSARGEALPVVEEWEMDAVAQIPPNHLVWHVCLDKDGALLDATETRFVQPFTDEVIECEYTSLHNSRDVHRPRDGVIGHYWMFATNQQHAVKIANERRLQQLAHGTFMVPKKKGSDDHGKEDGD